MLMGELTIEEWARLKPPLLTRFGKWKTVYERHRRWSADGTWEKTFTAVLADAEGRVDWSMV